MNDQEEFGRLTQPLGNALIGYLPQHFRSGYCIVDEVPKHRQGRLRYQIGCDEHPDQGTNRPSPDLHDAVHAIAQWFARKGERFPGIRMRVMEAEGGAWKFSMEIGPEKRALTDDEEHALWQEVYEARERLYREHVGELPEYIQKMMNLTGVWPGGGLFQIEKSKIRGACVTTSFGLTNSDLPTTVRATGGKQSSEGNALSFSATLEGRTPRWVPSDLAGYGYEIMVLTKKPEPWAANLVGFAVNAEIQRDVELLDRVREIGAVTVEEVAIGEGRSIDIVISAAEPPLPTSLQLPNGTMNLLVITRITRPEMELALREGQPALVAELAKAGIGQISDLDRRSIV